VPGTTTSAAQPASNTADNTMPKILKHLVKNITSKNFYSDLVSAWEGRYHPPSTFTKTMTQISSTTLLITDRVVKLFEKVCRKEHPSGMKHSLFSAKVHITDNRFSWKTPKVKRVKMTLFTFGRASGHFDHLHL
jgi:hypothetical protein